MAGNVIAKATGVSRTAGTVIGAGVGTIAGALAGRVRDDHEKHDLLSELIAILNETKSVDTFSVTLAALAEMGPRAEPAIPAIIRNAERLGLLKDHLLAKEQNSEAVKRFEEIAPALERTIKAILHNEVSSNSGDPLLSLPPAGKKKQKRKTDPLLDTNRREPAAVPCVPCVPVTR